MTLRRLSSKRAARLPDEQAFRLALFERVKYRCEFCGVENYELQQHELQRGALRSKQRTCWFSTLALCAACHRVFDVVVGQHAVLLGLAILRRSRPLDYSLSRFIELVCPQAPRRFTELEVSMWCRRISGVGQAVER
jgi:hypothetical protein